MSGYCYDLPWIVREKDCSDWLPGNDFAVAPDAVHAN